MTVARHGSRTVSMSPARWAQRAGGTSENSFSRWSSMRCSKALRLRSRICRLVLLMSLISFAFTMLGLLGHIHTIETEPENVNVHDLRIADWPQPSVDGTTHHYNTSRLQDVLARHDPTEGQNLSRNGESKEEPASSPAPTGTPAVTQRNFSEKFRHHYVNDTKEFFSRLEEIVKQEWKPHTSRTQQFRDDIRHGLGENGSMDNFIVTKKNTPRGEKLGFYMSGKPRKISSILWQNIPNDVIFKSGQFQSCSVVGSSGILRGSGCGKEIDRSQSVFRFNIAPVEGFEADVGSKTNLTTLNPSFVISKLNNLKLRKDVDQFGAILKQFKGSQLWLPAFAVFDNTAVITRMSRTAFNSKLVRPVLGHPEHFLSVSKLWRKTAMNERTWPTTGLYLILSLFDACDQINVFGFWPYETAINGSQVPYHYHNNITGRHDVHDFDTEFKSLVSLYEQGIINMKLGSCL
ncbi:alpha-2,8-sialyltransferase 8E-like [Patiria miniata]|uniref:Uncharacterized protein n=1 Tax=Patiria miniata TaxID=46514 RepID=A0A914BSE0_PATMI|nr:alpha-2,8-sialyltransferase 8E-like [Patiria miniata]